MGPLQRLDTNHCGEVMNGIGQRLLGPVNIILQCWIGPPNKLIQLFGFVPQAVREDGDTHLN